MIRVGEIRDRQPFTAVELEEPVIRLVPIRYGEQCVPAVAVTTEDSHVYYWRPDPGTHAAGRHRSFRAGVGRKP
jgi:hypothetical protein